MEELIETEYYNETLKLTVITWNIGLANDEKMNDLLENIIKIDTEVIIICFQETGTTIWKQFIKFFRNHFHKVEKLKEIGNDFFNFKIATYILFKNSKYELEHFSKGKKYFKKAIATKSFIITQINLKNTLNNTNYVFSIVNCHFPFDEEKFLNERQNPSHNWYDQAKDINEFIEQSNLQNVIISGDLNSRSVFTKDCYSKDIKDNTGIFKLITERLKKVSNEMPHYNFLDDNIIYKENISKYDLIPCLPGEGIENEKIRKLTYDMSGCTIDCRKYLIDFLLSVDVLKKELLNVDSVLFNKFDEGLITFLPTYKFDMKGKYHFEKNGEKRLPGYTDRILYQKNSSLYCTKYTSLNIKGNDHKPVLSSFVVNPVDESVLMNKFYNNIDKKSLSLVGGMKRNINPRTLKKVTKNTLNSSKKYTLKKGKKGLKKRIRIRKNVRCNIMKENEKHETEHKKKKLIFKKKNFDMSLIQRQNLYNILISS